MSKVTKDFNLWDVDSYRGTARGALNLAELYERWAYEPGHEAEEFWDIARRYRRKSEELALAEAADERRTAK